MMKRRVWVLWLLCLGLGPGAAGAVEWMPVSGIGEPSLTCVATDPTDPTDAKVILTSSERRLYRSGDGGLKWKKVASVRGQDTFRQIVFHAGVRGLVLAVSEKTLYTSEDGGRLWKRWRKPFGDLRMICATYADELGRVVHVGTDKGFYTLDLRDGTVRSEAGSTHLPVLGIGPGPDGSVIAVAAQGIYRSSASGWRLEKPFVRRGDIGEGGDALSQFDIEELAIAPVNTFVVHRQTAALTLIGTPQGVLTQHPGQPWVELRGAEALRELRAADVTADEAVYLAGKEGVYCWQQASTQVRDVSTGLAGAQVRDLDYQPASDTLYAATDRGLYRAVYVSATKTEMPQAGTPITSPSTAVVSTAEPAVAQMSEQEVLRRFVYEPTVTAVQERAIRYAEVHPDKITAWRRAASRKALLPSVSVGWDHDTNQTVDLDRGGTGDPDRFIIGPEERGMDWSVSVGWDLGDLLWNDDQTSIDTRSKLMVELRDDILNEVTHAYFERRRLQVETVLLPGREVGTRLERELRIQELTARIDALTGGWFGAIVERTHKEVPGHGGSSLDI